MKEPEANSGPTPRKVLPPEHLLQNEQGRVDPAFIQLYDEVLAILFRHDPIGINFVDNTDEYAPEARTILQRLREAESPEGLAGIIHEEFIHWFDIDMAGPKSRYVPIAHDVWKAWQSYKGDK